MPTPRVVQAIVRQRTSLAIDRMEANRLVGIALSSAAPDERVEIHGRDRRTGKTIAAHLLVREVIVPPQDFVSPA